ncbi:hypothetical protein NUU61_005178 [Penicillium alfredii]|uniref:Inner kinetochore subunit AME1 domain-containing protein n=1 Tax=Penicillium alfredii TaxID=1506179 RepID=A0A9W9K8B7_9EURO|nr:uncharacterized protein NUU61_005178 [Penicillium alfredii]KAJ5095822.1 hypothetical protein NUU61_005178 [Penicillium alfredii]
MASTREERLQMRQRGAGTRKIKEVNFGFSFGSPGIEPPEPQLSIPEAKVLPQTQPTTSTPPSLKPSQSSQNRIGTQRTPGSARNGLPQRPSTYDIPSDDGPEQTRSSKRRKISPPDRNLDTSSRRSPLRRDNGNSIPKEPDVAKETETQVTQAPEVSTTDIPAPQPTPVNEPTRTQASPLPEIPADELPQAGESRINGEASGIAVGDDNAPQPLLPEAESAGPEMGENMQELPSSSKAPLDQTQIGSGQPETTTKSRAKRQRSRSPQAGKSAKVAKEQTKASAKSTSPPSQKGAKSKGNARQIRGGSGDEPEAGYVPTTNDGVEANRAAPEPSSSINSAEKSNEASSKLTREIRKPRGRLGRKVNGHRSPSLAEDVAPEPETTVQNEPAKKQAQSSKTKRPRGRPSTAGKTTGTAEASERPDVSIDPAPAVGESSSAGAQRSRKPKSRKRTDRPEVQPEPEPEPEAEPEPEPEPEAESVAAALKKSRGCASGKKATRATASEPAPATEAQPEPEIAQDAPRRKIREPRGETVPVTVHRLANTTALGGTVSPADGSGDEEEDSADELSTRQKTKLPSRGGVNPADVLSQICRETLEKTLTTLKNGITNETNPTRRAEWSRKRKAVEAFGSELEGRLLDLSEMLDSNFVLGVQLKKAKREMMDLRSHLYRVRRERENVALQMDAVRAKHMEDERAKSARTTINNSLHSLELALDRQHRAPPPTDSSPANVEFLLRTMSDVSSRAPGAQGGLLNQVRAFNAQLEATARRLEQR